MYEFVFTYSAGQFLCKFYLPFKKVDTKLVFNLNAITLTSVSKKTGVHSWLSKVYIKNILNLVS